VSLSDEFLIKCRGRKCIRETLPSRSPDGRSSKAKIIVWPESFRG